MYSFYISQSKYEKLKNKKSEQAKSKRVKLILLSLLLFSSSILGCYLTYFMGRRLVKTIYYIPESNRFEVNFFSLFCFNKTLSISPEQIYANAQPLKIDSTSRHIVKSDIRKFKNYKYISTYGTGKWRSRPLFEYLISKQPYQQ